MLKLKLNPNINTNYSATTQAMPGKKPIDPPKNEMNLGDKDQTITLSFSRRSDKRTQAAGVKDAVKEDPTRQFSEEFHKNADKLITDNTSVWTDGDYVFLMNEGQRDTHFDGDEVITVLDRNGNPVKDADGNEIKLSAKDFHGTRNENGNQIGSLNYHDKKDMESLTKVIREAVLQRTNPELAQQLDKY